MTINEELIAADKRAEELFGDDAFCSVDWCGRREIFFKSSGTITEDVILLGRGEDFEEAFHEAIPFFARFCKK